MPTSDPFNITPVVSIVLAAKPSSICDVGCGFGKYGVLFREYLDIWQQRISKEDWRIKLVGIDAFGGYRNPIWDYIYNEIHVGLGQEILPKLGKFDLIFIGDVIEHLEKSEALKLISLCLERSTLTVISTPKEFFEQDALFKNEYERHRCVITPSDFSDCHFVTVSGISCNTFVASKMPLGTVVDLAQHHKLTYLRSRTRLRRFGKLGWPISAFLRFMCKHFA